MKTSFVTAFIALAVLGCPDHNALAPRVDCLARCVDDAECVGAQRCVDGDCVRDGSRDVAAPRVTLPATDGTLSVPFRVSVTGTGSEHVGAVAITDDVGEIEVDGVTLGAVSYSRTTFPGYTLFQTLAVVRERWVVVWLYCQDDKLVDIYLHSTDGLEISHETATGSCTESTETTDVTVRLPEVDLAVAPLRGDYRVQGRDIFLDGARPGAIRLGGREMVVLPYNVVDCTLECGPPGWLEVHSILVDTERGEACFAIIYLFTTDDEVTVAYSLSLPTLAEPAENVRACGRWERRAD